MTRISWEADNVKAVYEDMVSTALSLRMQQRVGGFQRIDGSGGDRGRDVQFRTATRLEAQELKSFTGRLGKEQGRREQVKRSLITAAGLQPDSWTLVVPIDPTPGELQWFDRLRSLVDFPLTWFGETELNALMADFPSVARYYLEDRDSEVVRLLREINQEQAALTNVEGGIERLRLLADRLDEISPHYRLDFTRVGEHMTMTVMPRYSGAEDDRPITVGGSFDFPDTEIGRAAAQSVEDFFAYGGEVEVDAEFTRGIRIDAPGGIGEGMTGGRLVIASHPIDTGLPIHGRLVIHRGRIGATGPSLPIRFDHRVAGNRGVTLTGADLTGSVNVRLRASMLDQRADVNLSFTHGPEDQLPGQLLPVLRFRRELVPGNYLAVQLGGHDMGEPMPVPDVWVESAPDPDLVSLLEDLDRIQSLTSTPFPVPDVFSSHEVGAIRRTARLLAGDAIELPHNTMTTTLVLSDEARAVQQTLVTSDVTRMGSVAGQTTVNICGHEIPLGETTTIVTGRIQDFERVQNEVASRAAGDVIELEIRAQPGTAILMMLGNQIQESAATHEPTADDGAMSTPMSTEQEQSAAEASPQEQ